MTLFKVTCLFALLAVGRPALAQVPVIAETKKGEIWESAGPKKQVLRQINGHWWSEDNREVTPPAKDKIFWTLESETGAVQFFHHRPLDLSRTESLHLFMRPKEVGSALGEPNRVVGSDNHATWIYYAADGTKLMVRFMDDGVLGEATYEAAGQTSWPVAGLERELNGRSIDDVLRERANQRALETYRAKPFAVRAQ